MPKAGRAWRLPSGRLRFFGPYARKRKTLRTRRGLEREHGLLEPRGLIGGHEDVEVHAQLVGGRRVPERGRHERSVRAGVVAVPVRGRDQCRGSGLAVGYLASEEVMVGGLAGAREERGGAVRVEIDRDAAVVLDDDALLVRGRIAVAEEQRAEVDVGTSGDRDRGRADDGHVDVRGRGTGRGVESRERGIDIKQEVEREHEGDRAKHHHHHVFNKRDYAKNGDLLEDKYFFVIRAEDFDTEDFKKYEGGESLWVDKEEISKLPNLFDDMDALMEMFEGNKFSFTEPKYTVKSY